MVHRAAWGSLTLLGLAFLFAPSGLHAQTTNQVSDETLRQILQRLERDEQELKELRKEVAGRPAAPQPTNVTSQVQQRLDQQDAEIKDLKKELAEAATPAEIQPKYPNLQFHGFADIDYSADSRKAVDVPGNTHGIPYGVGYYGIKNTFYFGELDLFVTSQLAQDVSVVTEDAISVGPDNHTGIDIERLYLEYRYNDNLIVDAGRFHTSLGYYNTTYHHGLWLQDAVGRPTFLEFEDSGGILPVHMVGISVHGAIPSGSLNLNYVVEAGNGEEFSTNGSLSSVQQLISISDSKAVNVALVARPDWMPGLQFGGNVYYDRITPDNKATPVNNQFIFGAHAVYHNAAWEFLNEGYIILDHPTGGTTHCDSAVYTQVARKFGAWTPYGRFTYYRIIPSDTLYSVDWDGGLNAGSHFGPSVGLRYDFTAFAALKLQYDYLFDTGFNEASRVTVQACCTF